MRVARLLPVVLFASAAAPLGCGALLGLDDLEKVSCVGDCDGVGPELDAGGGDDVPDVVATPDASDAGESDRAVSDARLDVIEAGRDVAVEAVPDVTADVIADLSVDVEPDVVDAPSEPVEEPPPCPVCQNDGYCVAGTCVYKSCQAWLDAEPSSVDGVYKIDPDLEGGGVKPFDAFCRMNSEWTGGWTLLLKIDGGKTTFLYDDPIWDPGSPTYKADSLHMGTTPFEEAKFPAYDTLAITSLLIGMSYNGREFVYFPVDLGQEWPSLADAVVPTEFTSAKWLTLTGLTGWSDCDFQGVNTPEMSIRIGCEAATQTSTITGLVGFGLDDPDRLTSCGSVTYDTSVEGTPVTSHGNGLGFVLAR